MRLKVVSYASRTTLVQLKMDKRNEELVKFAAGQLISMRNKKLGFPVRLGHL